MRKLGTPGATQLLAGAVNGSVMPSADGKSLLPVEGAGAFERWENCDTLISVSTTTSLIPFEEDKTFGVWSSR